MVRRLRKARSWLIMIKRAGERGQHAFEPVDRGKIEMVGRLVEQQDVGIADQRAGQRRPPALAARERAEPPRAVEADLRQHGVDADARGSPSAATCSATVSSGSKAGSCGR